MRNAREAATDARYCSSSFSVRSALQPSGYSKDVTMMGRPVAIKGATFKSIGDIASQPTGGGVISQTTQDITEFVGPGSLNVKVEGKNVQLLYDIMTNNKKNCM